MSKQQYSDDDYTAVQRRPDDPFDSSNNIYGEPIGESVQEFNERWNEEFVEFREKKIIDIISAPAFIQETNEKELANKIADRAADILSGYDPTRFENHSAIALSAATEILSESYRSTIESCAALARSLGCLGPSMCGGAAHHDPRCPQALSERLLGLLEGPVDASEGAVADAAGAASAGAPEDLPERSAGKRPVILKTNRYGFIW